MADRFQDRPLPDDLDRIDPRGRGPARGGGGGDSDPLAELARLIGQNDPFAGGGGGGVMGRANAKVQPQQRAPEPAPFRAPPQQQDSFDDQLPAGGPPPWIARTAQPPAPAFQQPEPMQPMQRYPGEQPQAQGFQQPQFQQPQFQQPQFRDEPLFDDRGRGQDPDSRYDDALFGQLDTGGGPGFGREEQFQDDPYSFQDDGYDDAEEDEPKRRNGFAKVAVVLALAVIGTGAAFAYRSYMGASSRGGEPPIIRADNSPTKIIPAVPADGIPKLPDRMTNGDQGEKIVSREETPVDVNTRSVGGPRVVFPPLNQNGNPPPPSMGGGAMAANDITAPPVATDTPPPSTLGNGEPRRIKTLSVRGDQGDGGMAAAAASPKAAAKGMARNSPAQANASANPPMQIAPQGAAAPAANKRMAAVNPAPPAQDAAPSAAPAAAADAGGDAGYLVQVSSQKSEADAQASFRSIKAKYADAMGSYTPVIKRVDIPGKGVMYRAMVGPFDTAEAANQFCKGLQTAGGQCFVPRK